MEGNDDRESFGVRRDVPDWSNTHTWVEASEESWGPLENRLK